MEPGTGKSAKAPENEKKPDLEKVSYFDRRFVFINPFPVAGVYIFK